MAVRECSRGLSAFSNVAGDTLERLLVLSKLTSQKLRLTGRMTYRP